MEYKIRWLDDHLEHHGILGMKWGIRRYQNPDGSLTPAGKKRYAKELSKMNSQRDVDNSVLEKIRNGAVDTSKMDSAYREYSTFYKTHSDFSESEEYHNAQRSAYEETLNWFKKHEPKYLEEIIAKNDGKETNLDSFHDFRKTYEGYEDAAITRAEKAFYKRIGVKPNQDDILFDKFLNEREKVVKELIGEFGKIKMKNLPKNRFNDYRELSKALNLSLWAYYDTDLGLFKW